MGSVDGVYCLQWLNIPAFALCYQIGRIFLRIMDIVKHGSANVSSNHSVQIKVVSAMINHAVNLPVYGYG